MQKTITVDATIRYAGKWCIGDNIICDHLDGSVPMIFTCGLFTAVLTMSDSGHHGLLLPLRCRACLDKTGDV